MIRGVAANLPRTVVVLGVVSFVNDAASEMITPLLPLFLTVTLGAGPAVVGLVEGLAEATASVLKVVSGRLADRGFGSKRLVLAGYGTSNLARPAIGLALGWGWVLALRFADRVGKGLRTAPRDAMIAAASTEHLRGRAFGFHRAMDHAGAVVGPLAAFAVLSAGAALGDVFLYSLIPGILVVGLVIWGLPADVPEVRQRPPSIAWSVLDRRLKALIGAAALLALAAVPEAFIVLWAADRGLPLAWVPLAWAVTSLAKMAVVMPAGELSDRIGRMPVLLAGWGLRALVLCSLGLATVTGTWVWILFVAYGSTLAITEAPERSLVGDAAPVALRGTAFGVYHLVTGMFALPGALLFGFLWERFGSGVAFEVAAALTLAGALVMYAIGRGAGTRSTLRGQPS